MIVVIGKVALLMFLAVAVTVLLVRFLRRARGHGFPRPVDDPGLAAYNRAVFGPQPRVPPPAWAVDDAADPPDEALNR